MAKSLSWFLQGTAFHECFNESLFLINALWVGLEFSLYSKSIRERDLTFGGETVPSSLDTDDWIKPQ